MIGLFPFGRHKRIRKIAERLDDPDINYLLDYLTDVLIAAQMHYEEEPCVQTGHWCSVARERLQFVHRWNKDRWCLVCPECDSNTAVYLPSRVSGNA
jgi:hypothetical protein